MADDEFKIKEDKKKPPFATMMVQSVAKNMLRDQQIADIDLFIGTLFRVKGLLEADGRFAFALDDVFDDVKGVEDTLFETMCKYIKMKKDRGEGKNVKN